MRGIRPRVRLAAALALFAMGLQLVVTFGHIHLDDLLPPSAVQQVAQVMPNGPGAPPPSPKGDGDEDDGVCAICALIQLANISIPSVEPLLPVPTAIRWIRLETPAESGQAVVARKYFRARAPPLT